MSKEQRKAMYKKLVAEDRLSQDDGALVREFGEPNKGKLKESDTEPPKKAKASKKA